MSRVKTYVFIISIFLIIVLGVYYVDLSNKLKDESTAFENFKKSSKSLILLKKKWKSKNDFQMIFARIKRFAKPTKEIRKNGMQIFDFQNLTQMKLNRVLKILLNSSLVIKNIDIKKYKNKISLHVEVKL